MARTTKIKVADTVLDERFYPRASVNDRVIADMVRLAEGGSIFPPIVVARTVAGEPVKPIIVDGAHRVGMHKALGEELISAEQRDYESWAALFKDAIALNSVHGLKMTNLDRLHSAVRAEELGIPERDLAMVLKVPLEYLQALKPRHAIAGEKGSARKIPLRASTRHLSGMTVTEDQADALESAPGSSYLLVLRQLRDGLRYGLLPPQDRHPTLWKELAELRSELDEVLCWDEVRPGAVRSG